MQMPTAFCYALHIMVVILVRVKMPGRRNIRKCHEIPVSLVAGGDAMWYPWQVGRAPGPIEHLDVCCFETWEDFPIHPTHACNDFGQL
jgi:hypothetical protein